MPRPEVPGQIPEKVIVSYEGEGTYEIGGKQLKPGESVTMKVAGEPETVVILESKNLRLTKTTLDLEPL